MRTYKNNPGHSTVGHRRPGPWRQMAELNCLCPANAIHPLPVRMTCIARQPDTRSGDDFQYIYACPFHPCLWREGWILGREGRPFKLWRGLHKHGGR